MSKALVIAGVIFATNKLATVNFVDLVPCTGITLDYSTKYVGNLSSFTLTPSVTPSNTTDVVTWTTSNSSVATVNNGVVTPQTYGNVTITATCGGYSASCYCVISDSAVPCTGITLNESSVSQTDLDQFTLTATPTPSNTTDSVVWTSSDTSVATVVGGVVTPVGLGTTTITATCGEYSATCSLSIDNVAANCVVVAGYDPSKAGRTNTAVSINQVANMSAGARNFIVARNSSDTSLYIIDYHAEPYDTGTFRFVPVPIIPGAVGIKVSCSIESLNIRAVFIDSTQHDNITGIGAKGLSGKAQDGGWDNSTAASTLYVEIPTDITGMDSFTLSVAYSSWNHSTAPNTETDTISVEFVTSIPTT